MEKSPLSVKEHVRTNYESNKYANESLKVQEREENIFTTKDIKVKETRALTAF